MLEEHYVVSRTLRVTPLLVQYSEVERVFNAYAWRIDDGCSQKWPGGEEQQTERNMREYLLPDGKRMVTAALSVVQPGEHGMAGDTLVQFDVMHQQPLREGWSGLLAKLGAPRRFSFFIPSEIKEISAAFIKLGAVWAWEKCYAAPLPHSDVESLEKRLQHIEGRLKKFSRRELDARLKAAVMEAFSPEKEDVSKASVVYPYPGDFGIYDATHKRFSGSGESPARTLPE